MMKKHRFVLVPGEDSGHWIRIDLGPHVIRGLEILNRLGDSPIGVEVGVFGGALSATLLSLHPGLSLYMVDPWSADASEEYKASGDFHTTLSQERQDEYYRQSCSRVSFAGGRAKVIRKRSVDASKDFEPKCLDFVFIDADHSYEAVREDIESWFPKVKEGGWICGHDYDHPDYPGFGVKRAVDERFPLIERGGNFTWFYRK